MSGLLTSVLVCGLPKAELANELLRKAEARADFAQVL